MKTLIASILLLFPLALNAQGIDEQLDQAFQYYVAGEQAETNAERSRNFHEALNAYTIIENQYPESGKLQYNIANSYFQLGEYGWAILHYHRAQRSRPRDDRVQRNLEVAAQHAGVRLVSQDSFWSQLLLFHTYFSEGERRKAVFTFSLLAILFLSANIWVPRNLLRVMGMLMAILVFGGMISLATSRYFESIEAIAVNAATLHTDAGAHYAEVLDRPIIAGTKVSVLEVLQGGRWLKVQTPTGTVGYASADRIRII